MPFTLRPFRSLSLAYFSGFMSIIALLFLSSGPAYAEWVEVGGSKAGMTVYVNPDTIRRKGDVAKMWHLFDYKTTKTYLGKSFLSVRAQRQYDCADERTRSLAEMGFSDNMGSGEMAYSIPNESKWEPVPPDSIAESLWKIACGKE